MKISILGIRGLPSSYSGFETFISELAPRLVQRGHDVTVYCRSSLFPEKRREYLGVRLRYLPSIEHKMFSTLSHSLLSMFHASLSKSDVIFVVNAANGFFGLIPRLLNKKAVLNVDGMEWLRPKWNSLARWFFKTSARAGTKFYHRIVTDADEMHRLYAREFGINSVYIAYGANIESSEDPSILAQYNLKPFDYYLIASRLIPDNNADKIVEAFVSSGSSKILAIAGGADYAGNTVERNFMDKLKSLANGNVRFLGHISDPKHIKELHCNCFAYIHGHMYGGINPALLKALGFGNLVFALDTPFSREVLDGGAYGFLFKDSEHLSQLINELEKDAERCQQFRSRAPNRIRERFTWEKITEEYESLFRSVIDS